MTARSPRRGDLAWVLGLVFVKVAVSCALLAVGFTHISDDDYSRTVIAQTFAHAPRLDPSGTSWLPLPFWLMGGAMAIFGRTLVVARIVSIVLSSFAIVAPYAGARAMGLGRRSALVAALVAGTLPVCAWVGAATVPEGTTGLVLAGAVLGIASSSRRAWALGALGMLLVCWSRYEAWPMALGAGLVLAWRAARGRSVAPLLLAVLSVLGPLAWLGWNAHAHHDALHFLARVSHFRQDHAATSLATRLIGYPVSLATAFPEALALLVAGLLRLRDATFRRKWALALALALGSLALLIAADVRGGAPTHHAERALVAIAAIAIAFGVHGASAWVRTARARALAGAAVAVWAVTAAWRAADFPGRAPSEDRTAQLARGAALRVADGSLHGAGAPFEVVPCAYEHFALIAAYGAPERVVVLPPQNRPVTADCPAVRAAALPE